MTQKSGIKRKPHKQSAFLEKNVELKTLGDSSSVNEANLKSSSLIEINNKLIPEWIKNPRVVFSTNCSDDSQNLKISECEESLGLNSQLIERLTNNGVTHVFPVQQNVIPFILNDSYFRPSDLCVCAPTGSGKTLAFVLPILQILKSRVQPKIRAMVVAPVQDLVHQIYSVFQAYVSKSTIDDDETSPLRVRMLSTEHSFAVEQSKLVARNITDDAYLSLVDILICTPGRLEDHIKRTPGFDLSNLRFLVIDEADRVLDATKPLEWLSHIDDPSRKQPHSTVTLARADSYAKRMDEFRSQHQKLLFSATLTERPGDLNRIQLYKPVLFTSHASTHSLTKTFEHSKEMYKTPPNLKQSYICVQDSLKKHSLLHKLLTCETYMGCKTLVFTNSIQHAQSLTTFLIGKFGKDGQKIVAEISSRTKQHHRKMFNQYRTPSEDPKQQKLRILVCTDALTRGIDLDGSTQLVVSYDAPLYLNTYIHRVGRTARAGRTGSAITLTVAGHETSKFKKMLENEAGIDIKGNEEFSDVDET